MSVANPLVEFLRTSTPFALIPKHLLDVPVHLLTYVVEEGPERTVEITSHALASEADFSNAPETARIYLEAPSFRLLTCYTYEPRLRSDQRLHPYPIQNVLDSASQHHYGVVITDNEAGIFVKGPEYVQYQIFVGTERGYLDFTAISPRQFDRVRFTQQQLTRFESIIRAHGDSFDRFIATRIPFPSGHEIDTLCIPGAKESAHMVELAHRLAGERNPFVMVNCAIDTFDPLYEYLSGTAPTGSKASTGQWHFNWPPSSLIPMDQEL